MCIQICAVFFFLLRLLHLVSQSQDSVAELLSLSFKTKNSAANYQVCGLKCHITFAIKQKPENRKYIFLFKKHKIAAFTFSLGDAAAL